MDASSLEVLFDPSKCSKLSIDQKREMVYKLSKWSEGAVEILHTWSRHDILQILCAELGKERKYTGLNKMKIIEHLLKVIHEKKPQDNGGSNSNAPEPQQPPSQKDEPYQQNDERTSKRQRKSSQPPTPNDTAAAGPDVGPDNIIVYCKNLACRAKMSCEDMFCKRCSCCICSRYDDNKDPSLWLVCCPESPFRGSPCGMSCHLECALRHENCNIAKNRRDEESPLDGSFCCASCGKENDLLSSCRKQLVVAKETRRVDILCYRLSLAQKILAGTKLYQNLCGGIDEAVRKLEQEVGPLTGLPVKTARGIVNRLALGPEIQRLCSSAVKSLDLLLSERSSDIPSNCSVVASKHVRIEDVNDSSVTIILDSDSSASADGYELFLRKFEETNYPSEPTCRLHAPNIKYHLSDLNPNTDYFLMVVVLEKGRESGPIEIQFRTGNPETETQNPNSNCSDTERSQSPATNCSSLSNLSSVEDETANNITPCGDDNINPSDNTRKEDQISRVPKDNSTNGSQPSLQITPHKMEKAKNENPKKNRRRTGEKDSDEPQAGSSSKKREENRDGECNGIIGEDKDFEYCVKVIRRLECEGHIETTFRRKLLTWYSLRATSREVRVVRVFVDTFIEDPESLAEQLVDAFSGVILDQRCSTVRSGFCSKLWH